MCVFWPARVSIFLGLIWLDLVSGVPFMCSAGVYDPLSSVDALSLFICCACIIVHCYSVMFGSIRYSSCIARSAFGRLWFIVRPISEYKCPINALISQAGRNSSALINHHDSRSPWSPRSAKNPSSGSNKVKRADAPGTEVLLLICAT